MHTPPCIDIMQAEGSGRGDERNRKVVYLQVLVFIIPVAGRPDNTASPTPVCNLGIGFWFVESINTYKSLANDFLTIFICHFLTNALKKLINNFNRKIKTRTINNLTI